MHLDVFEQPEHQVFFSNLLIFGLRGRIVMAYDQEVQKQIERIIGKEELTSKRMFGGVCYLYGGNMAFGIYKDNLIVRLGSPEEAQKAIESGEALAFDITGRPMKGWVMIPKASLKTSAQYRRWLDQGLAFAKSLPKK